VGEEVKFDLANVNKIKRNENYREKAIG